MPLSPADRELIQRVRTQFESKYQSDDRFGTPARHDREDESTLATRFPVGDNFWLEFTVRPFLPQLRAGIVTDDRWKSEDLEQVIEDSGDTMSEFIEMGFEESGLTWKDPPVEHYRDQGVYFYFATPIDVPAIRNMGDPPIFDKVCRVFEGYFEAFRPAIQKASTAG